MRSARGPVVLEVFGAYVSEGHLIAPAWASLKDIRAGTTLYFQNYKVRTPRIKRDLQIHQPLVLEVIQ